MNKEQLITMKVSTVTFEEISVTSERLTYLLQTISENFFKMEEKQRFNLIEIAWILSGDIDNWMNAEEVRREQAN